MYIYLLVPHFPLQGSQVLKKYDSRQFDGNISAHFNYMDYNSKFAVSAMAKFSKGERKPNRYKIISNGLKLSKLVNSLL